MNYEEIIEKYPLLAPLATTQEHHEHLVMLAYHAGRWDGIDTALKINKRGDENVQA